MTIEPPKILDKIIQLLMRADRDWVSVGRLLEEGIEQKTWDTLFGSTRQAIVKISEQTNVKPASLWRFLTSVRIYDQLEDLFSHHSIPFPALTSSSSAENIELLGRLRRVMPMASLLPAAVAVLENRMSRGALRNLWNDYKPVMQGKTVRGRGKPVLDHDIHAIRKSQVLSMIRSTPFWVPKDRLPDVPQHEILTQIVLLEMTLDAVIIVRSSESATLPEFHAVKFIDHSPDDTEYELMSEIMENCDALWFAIHLDDFIDGDGSLRLPVGAGLLQIEDFAKMGTRMRVISNPDLTQKQNGILPRCLIAHMLGFG